MINAEAMERIKELCKLYEQRWGKEVDLTIIPPGCTQDKLAVVLERIVDTGESVLVGWNKICKQSRSGRNRNQQISTNIFFSDLKEESLRAFTHLRAYRD